MNERDVILRERAAFTAGWSAAQDPLTKYHVDWEARERYPLTRPRVVNDPHIAGAAWRIVGGRVQYRDREGNEWQSTERMVMCNGQPTAFSPTPERIEIWTSLLSQPETVDV